MIEYLYQAGTTGAQIQQSIRNTSALNYDLIQYVHKYLAEIFFYLQ